MTTRARRGADDDAALIEERRWRIERQRWRFRGALLLASGLFAMYFGVAPISAAYGRPLELPRVEIVVIFLALISAPAFGVTGGALAKAVASFPARVRITLQPAPEALTGGDEDDDDAK
jgi:hypothetical protein